MFYVQLSNHILTIRFHMDILGSCLRCMCVCALQYLYNAGNFQEYDYETEWLECDWKAVHKTLHLVSAFWYPWLYK